MNKAVMYLFFMLSLVACSGTSGSGGSHFDSTVNFSEDGGNNNAGGGAGGGEGLSQTATPVLSLSSPTDNNRRATGSTGASFVIAGTCTYLGGDITISDGGSLSQTTTCGSGGTFSTTIDFTAVADGTYNLTVTQTNDNSVSDATAVTIENIANYCTAGRVANVAFANSGEGGIDGLSSANAFTICTVAQFNYLNTYIGLNPGGGFYFTLMENLDFGGSAPTAFNFGSNTFDGNYLTLEDVVMNSTTHPDNALFGEDWGTTSNISNLHLKDMTMTLTADPFGAGFILPILYNGSSIQNITGENLTITKNFNNGATDHNGIGIITGYVEDGAILSDISLDSISIDIGQTGAGYGTATFGSVGGVVGDYRASNNLTNISISNATISAYDSVGGAVGRAELTAGNFDNIDITSSTIDVYQANAGGVIGAVYNSDHTFNDMHFTGTINGYGAGNDRVGGLIGSTFGGAGGGNITNSSAVWSFPSADYNIIGGLVGQLDNMDLQTSYANITIATDGDYIGGAVGELSGTSSLVDVYVLGTITTTSSSDDVIGGLFGFDAWSTASATLQRVYFGGTISNSGGAQIHQIGLGDANPAAVVSCTSDCYYNSTNNGFGYTGIAGVTGLTDAQMQDKTNMPGIDASGNWKIDSSVSIYPVLSWQ